MEDFCIDEEQDVLEIEADSMDEDGVLALMVLLQQVMNDVKADTFTFRSVGIVDNDYYSYTAFEIECRQDTIKRRTVDFTIENEVEELDDHEEWVYVNILVYFEPCVRSLRATIPEAQSHRNSHQKHYSTVLLT